MSEKINLNDLLNPNFLNSMHENSKEMTVFQKTFQKDETLYKPTFGDKGKPNVVDIRFLPSQYASPVTDSEGKTIFYNIASWFEHWYEEGNLNIKEICPKTNLFFGEKEYSCPFCDYVNDAYPWTENMTDLEKRERSKRKSKRISYVNVLVEKDQLFPENEGKVLKMRMNYEIFDVVSKTLNGEKIDDTIIEESQNIFDILNFGKVLRMVVSPNKLNKKWTSFQCAWHSSPINIKNKSDKDKIITAISSTHDLYESFLSNDKLKIKTTEELSLLVDSIYGTNRVKILNNKNEAQKGIEEAIKKQREIEKSESDEEIPTFKDQKESSSITDYRETVRKSTATKPEELKKFVEKSMEVDSDEEFSFNPDEFVPAKKK